MRRSRIVPALALAFGAFVAASASAQDLKEEKKAEGFRTSSSVAAAQAAAKESQKAVFQRHIASLNDPNYFGTQCCQILQIPASAFKPIDSAVPVGDSGLGYLYPSSFGGTYDFWAAVELPTGAHISYVDLYYQDTDAANDLRMDLRALSGGNNGFLGTGDPTSTTLASVSSVDATGYNYAVTSMDYVVNNNVAFDAAGAQLILRTFFLSTSGAQKFKSVDIWWYRDVSPAPATASFLDVPTTDFGFQYIEALKRSGITGGCGDGTNYCPTDPVTRRQMAIFVAKGLGLYWPF